MLIDASALIEASVMWGPEWLRGPVPKEALPFILTPMVLLGFQYRRSLSPLLRRGYAALLAAAIVAFAALCVVRARSNVLDPPAWDVQCFWLYGQVAVSGRDFYLPSSLREVARAERAAGEPVSADEDFQREVLDVGFPYPPPTMLLTAPLGGLDLRTGALVWYLIQFLALGAAIVLLWRTFFPASGAIELAFTAAMVLTLRSTYSTIAFGQTGLLVLLLLVLFWRNRDRTSGGGYLGLAMIVKPIAAFLLVQTVLARRWRSVLATFVVLAGLSLVTALVFGPGVFVTYLTDNPVGRLPHWMYTLAANQSLAAVFVRATGYDFTSGSPLTSPAFMLMAAAIVGATFWVAVRLARSRSALALALMIPAALLVYPQSLENYGVLLLLPMLFLWTRRDELRIGPLASIAFITAAYALVRFDAGATVFFATALTWVVLLAVAFRELGHVAVRAEPRPVEVSNIVV